MSENVNCGNCRYFDGDRCHRNAPIPTDVMQPLQTLWPRVAAGEWCGEWSSASGETIHDVVTPRYRDPVAVFTP